MTRSVLAEVARFEADLPHLLTYLEDRWVVYRDGAVQGDFATLGDAYDFAVERFGVNGGQVVAEVTKLRLSKCYPRKEHVV